LFAWLSGTSTETAWVPGGSPPLDVAAQALEVLRRYGALPDRSDRHVEGAPGRAGQGDLQRDEGLRRLLRLPLRLLLRRVRRQRLRVQLLGSPRIASTSSLPGTRVGTSTYTLTTSEVQAEGLRADNPFLSSSFTDQYTPYIAGLRGGAELYGLLTTDITRSSFTGLLPVNALTAPPADALAAVFRVDVGPGAFADDYTGFDMVVFVNLANIVLTSPMLGVVPGSSTLTFETGLLSDGVGVLQSLNALNPGDIWVTLIPDTTVKVNASIGGPTSPIQGVTLIDGSVGAENYITAFRPAGPVVNELSGLDAIAVRNLDIPDSATLVTTLRVQPSFTIADLNVSLDITHTFDGDLDVFLISPSGTQVELFTDVGGSGNNFVGTVLDDEAFTSITAGSLPFTGSFRPEGSLAAFDGQSSAGTWTLRVTDDADVDIGTLDGWSLTITATDGSVHRVVASPAPSFTSGPRVSSSQKSSRTKTCTAAPRSGYGSEGSTSTRFSNTSVPSR